MKNLFVILFVLFSFLLVNAQPINSLDTTTSNDKNKSESLVNIKREPVSIPKFAVSPAIDGKVDEEIWKKGAVFKDLIQTNPGDNVPSSKPTEVYVGYDEKFFYIAFKCWDEKDKIRATIAQRDNVFGEDNVRFWLDTYDDQRRAYVLGFNPLGIQQDGIVTENQGTDFNVDILMESKGVIEDWGWSVEVKIPFKSLRYTAGKGKSWGFNIARNIDRLNDEFNSWVPLPRDNPGFLNKFGKITGLDEIKTERTLEIIPTLTLKETGRRTSQTEFSNPPIEPDFGFTAKYQITPNVTLDAAYNPDFADTEADAPVVEANQRFPIFFSEKRPFFLEGVDVFRTPIQAVYTRRVENPDVALKLTGKIGKNSFGIFGALDDPLSGNKFKDKAYTGVVRLKRDIGKESHIGLLGTYREFGKDRLERPNATLPFEYVSRKENSKLLGFDTRWKINKNTEFTAQVLGSTSLNYFYNVNTNENAYRGRDGISHNYEFNYDQKNYGFGFGGNGTTKDFRAEMGFTQRTNSMVNYVYGSLRSDPKPKDLIIRKFFNSSFGVRNDYEGRLQGWGLDFNINLSMKGNMEAGFGGSLGPEIIYEDEFGPKRTSSNATNGAFFGNPKREAFGYGGFGFFYKRFNKRFAINSSTNLFFNSFEYDFGAGRKFERVSLAYLQARSNNSFLEQLDPGKATSFGFDVGVEYKPTDKLNFNLGFRKSSLVRNDTERLAFQSNIYTLRSTYQFSRFVNLKARLDYNTLNGRLFGEYTFGWTPSPGKALYVGYNDSWSYKGYEFNRLQPNFLQLNRTFFIKMSYLFRKSF